MDEDDYNPASTVPSDRLAALAGRCRLTDDLGSMIRMYMCSHGRDWDAALCRDLEKRLVETGGKDSGE